MSRSLPSLTSPRPTPQEQDGQAEELHECPTQQSGTQIAGVEAHHGQQTNLCRGHAPVIIIQEAYGNFDLSAGPGGGHLEQSFSSNVNLWGSSAPPAFPGLSSNAFHSVPHGRPYRALGRASGNFTFTRTPSNTRQDFNYQSEVMAPQPATQTLSPTTSQSKRGGETSRRGLGSRSS